jgi:hypothetical protein
MKISENFDLKELVNPNIYSRIGDRAADFLNVNTPSVLEDLRADFGPITVNDWPFGGNYKDSGLREPVIIPSKDDLLNVIKTMNVNRSDGDQKVYDELVKLFKGVGAPMSSHRFGCTFDLKFKDHKPEYVYFHILNNQDKYPYISRMENAERTVTWLHIEICTLPRKGDIIVFNP